MFDHIPPVPDRAVPLQQSPVYHDALIRIGARAQWQPLPGGGTAVLLRRSLPLGGDLALLSRPDLGELPRPEMLAGLRRAIGARALIVNAETAVDAAALSGAGFVRLGSGQPVALLSLEGTSENWLARMDGKWRNRLRHGQRQGLSVTARPYPPDPCHWLFHRDAETQAAQRYRSLPPALVTAMAMADPSALHLLTARQGGGSVAAMLFARHGSEANYLIGWCGARGRATSAHPVLLWEAMATLHALGVARIDLGQCCSRAAPGLARFKRGTGAVVRPLGGTWADAALGAPLHAALRSVRRKTMPTQPPPSP